MRRLLMVIVSSVMAIVVLLAAQLLLVDQVSPPNHTTETQTSLERPAQKVTVDHRAENVVNLPDNLSVTPAADPFLTTLSVDELLAALLAAASNYDESALSLLRLQLLQLDAEEVGRKALALLDIERAELANPPSKHSERVRQLRAACLLYFGARSQPQSALSVLRYRWSEGNLTDERRDKWLFIEKHGVDTLASMALMGTDLIESNALSMAIAMDLVSDAPQLTSLYELITDAYVISFPDGEIPDPWMSRIVGAVGARRSYVPVQNWSIFEVCLRGLQTQTRLSGRLRAQIQAVLLQDPVGYWELMDALRAVETIRAAAQALVGYLASHSLTHHELNQIILLLHQRFGSTFDSYREFTDTALRIGADKVPLERWRELASALADIGVTEENPAQWQMAIYLLHGMRCGWSANHYKTLAPTDMFSGDPTNTLDRLRTLHARAIQLDAKGESGTRGVAAGRVLELVWLVDATIYSKLEIACAFLEDRHSLSRTEFLAVVNGLRRNLSHLDESCGVGVAELFDILFERFSYDDNIRTPAEQRPLLADMREAITMRQIGTVLAACGYPALASHSYRAVSQMALAVHAASSAWQPDIGRGISQQTIDTTKSIASECLLHYPS
jgi:hypothetical protein